LSELETVDEAVAKLLEFTEYPKARAYDVPESPSHMPLPVKLTVCGLLGSLSLMTRVADRAPAALGLNARLIVQLPPPATLLPATHVELD
jgi:hypothetical protein